MREEASLFFVGVYGRAMGSIAIEMAELGWKVYGSGVAKFPPMDEKVELARIEVLDRDADLPGDVKTVIVSGTLGRGVSFVEQALDRGVRVIPFARFLEEQFLWKSRNLVVAGTNGKTTTTAMLIRILQDAGLEPDYLLGGEMPCGAPSVRMREAGVTVLEGDEYAAGFGDRNPKFLYYRPRVLAVTNMVFDHPEAYRDEREYKQLFAYLLLQLPNNGALILSVDDERLSLLKERSKAPVMTVGFADDADERIESYVCGARGCSFSLRGQHVQLNVCGKMNARNAAMAMLMAETEGVSFDVAAAALADFKGVAERQEIVYDSERATVIVEEAYHPDSLREFLSSLKDRFPERRILLAMQLRFTGGGDQYHQAELPAALADVGLLIWTPPFNFRTFSTVPFDEEKFVLDLTMSQVRVEKSEGFVGAIREYFLEGDVIVISHGPGPRGVIDAVVAGVQ
jgi:UDP-N-acetylmuramate: L-alanyl-gamma-D-glutamyl-meso-diaminopimelate ligase